MNNQKLKIFYDGKCYLCYHEVMHYLKRDKNNLLEAVDIENTNFDAKAYGLDDKKVKLHLHVMDTNGNIKVGVDSFFEIWKRVGPYHVLIPVLSLGPIKWIADRFYNLFALYIRPHLPKRKSCEGDACSID